MKMLLLIEKKIIKEVFILNKTIRIGFLMCLTCLYLMNDVWGTMGYAIGGYLFPVAVIITLIGIFSQDEPV